MINILVIWYPAIPHCCSWPQFASFFFGVQRSGSNNISGCWGRRVMLELPCAICMQHTKNFLLKKFGSRILIKKILNLSCLHKLFKNVCFYEMTLNSHFVNFHFNNNFFCILGIDLHLLVENYCDKPHVFNNYTSQDFFLMLGNAVSISNRVLLTKCKTE